MKSTGTSSSRHQTSGGVREDLSALLEVWLHGQQASLAKLHSFNLELFIIRLLPGSSL